MMRPNISKSSLFIRLSRWRNSESAAGIVLMLAALAAIMLANSGLADRYHALFEHRLGYTPIARLDTLHRWINDAAMALFFFTVGLEIKRELLNGDLATPAKRRLPVLAALAGMAVPALVYLAAGGSAPQLLRGWAIPAATDIAFALGVIGLLGTRLPRSIRLFLLSVAIIDDLGAVVIIALVYTAGLDLAWLLAAGLVLAVLIALNALRVTRLWAYALLAIVLWYCVLHSGVHATVAGVAAALTVPLQLDARGDSPLLRLEHALVPWSGFVVVPLFGFANAGIGLAGAELAAPLPLAILLGLVIGKPVGVFGAVAIADRLGIAARPALASWPQLFGMALLCGIGFTMSLFIAELAFPAQPALIDQARLGVFAGSLISALLGYVLMRSLAIRPPAP
jgi:Na+:H+ antiporter, NhaA family